MKHRIAAFFLIISILAGCTTVLAADTAEPLSPSSPHGVLVTGDGTFLVCDAWRNSILSYDGKSWSTTAGQTLGLSASGDPAGGYRDGAAAQALFDSPDSIVPWLDGWAVSDPGNNAVRYLTAKGEVRTVAGTEQAGKQNGDAAHASFSAPTGLAVDSDGTLYVADTGNNLIRCISKAGTVTTFAGTGTAGFADGQTTAAQFDGPTGLAWYNGALYVADTGNQRIRVIRNGTVTTLAGAPTQYADSAIWAGDYIDGKTDRACFDGPTGVAVDEDGTVYVADTGNAAVRVIADGTVSTLKTDTQLYAPRGIVVSGQTLYVTDSLSGAVAQCSLTAEQAVVFSDVPQTLWCHDAVTEAAASGLFSGVGGGAFDPDGAMTRAMFVTALGRLDSGIYRNDVIAGDAAFADVSSGAWYADSVNWAAQNRIVSGVSGTSFEPNAAVTREQAASFLHRWCAYAGLSLSDTGSAHSNFSDADETSDWAADDLQWAVSVGLMQGDNGALRPGDALTRAEAAQLLIHFCALI